MFPAFWTYVAQGLMIAGFNSRVGPFKGGNMKRHSWKGTESQRGFSTVERCEHCHTERVRSDSAKTLYEYRGGKALAPRDRALPQNGRWVAFIAGVIPQCVER